MLRTNKNIVQQSLPLANSLTTGLLMLQPHLRYYNKKFMVDARKCNPIQFRHRKSINASIGKIIFKLLHLFTLIHREYNCKKMSLKGNFPVLLPR